MNIKKICTSVAALIAAIGLTGCGGNAAPYATGADAVAKADEFAAKLAGVSEATQDQLTAAYPGIDFSLSVEGHVAATQDSPMLTVTEDSLSTVGEIGLRASLKAALNDLDVRARASASLDMRVKEVKTLNATMETGVKQDIVGALDLRYQLNKMTLSDYALIAMTKGDVSSAIGAKDILAYGLAALGNGQPLLSTADFGFVGMAEEDSVFLAALENFLAAHSDALVTDALSARERNGKYEFELDVSKLFSTEHVRAFAVSLYRVTMPNDGTLTDEQYQTETDAAVAEFMEKIKIAAQGKIYFAVRFNGDGIPVEVRFDVTDLTFDLRNSDVTVLEAALKASLTLQAGAVSVAEITLADMQAAYPDLSALEETPSLESLLNPQIPGIEIEVTG